MSGFSWKIILSLRPPKRCPDELIAILVSLVLTDLEIREETLNSLVEGDVVGSKFIAFEVILNV